MIVFPCDLIRNLIGLEEKQELKTFSFDIYIVYTELCHLQVYVLCIHGVYITLKLNNYKILQIISLCEYSINRDLLILQNFLRVCVVIGV